jgi:hypothetical protein
VPDALLRRRLVDAQAGLELDARPLDEASELLAGMEHAHLHICGIRQHREIIGGKMADELSREHPPQDPAQRTQHDIAALDALARVYSGENWRY